MSRDRILDVRPGSMGGAFAIVPRSGFLEHAGNLARNFFRNKPDTPTDQIILFGRPLGESLSFLDQLTTETEQPVTVSDLIVLLQKHPDIPEGEARDVLSQISVGEPSITGEIKLEGDTFYVITPRELESLTQIVQQNPEHIEQMISLLIHTVARNQEAGRTFVSRLRAKTVELLKQSPYLDNPSAWDTVKNDGRDHSNAASSRSWYDYKEIIALADRWHVPILFFKNVKDPAHSQEHYLLALKLPERTNNGWNVLVYDPMIGGETHLKLDDWDPRAANVHEFLQKEGMETGAFCNSAGFDQIKEQTYTYALAGDVEIARDAHLFEAKQAKLQFNIVDCGPMVLFMAMIRAGIKDDRGGFNTFKFSGCEQLERDLGIHIDRRANILGN